MDFSEELKKIITDRGAMPYLFIGSGLSRRYLNLDDWTGLLSRFAQEMGKNYSYYRSQGNNNLPRIANLISNDYHSYWWESNEKNNAAGDDFTQISSPLRYEIAKYLEEKLSVELPLLSEDYDEEIKLLQKTNVDGIITTNWDTFLEKTFSKYKTYVGQEGLLFSNPLNMAEIYKIHGCVSNPESLVLTDDDYTNYNEKNAYLAAKLITIFVEHPIIFIGYSITDPNIQRLLKSIAFCIGEDNLDRLRDNLIFLHHRQEGDNASIEKSTLTIEQVVLPIISIKSASFSPVYQAIINIDRKLPAHILRFCKEQIYEIVQSSTPEKKLAVLNYDDITSDENIEVVLGIGVKKELATKGYKPLTMDDILEDIILDNKHINAKRLLNDTIPNFPSNFVNVPIYKYLRATGINTLNELNKIPIGVRRFALDLAQRANIALPTQYEQTSFVDFIDNAPLAKVSELAIRFQDYNSDVIKDYLIKQLSDPQVKRHHLRKLIKEYDAKVYGIY